MKEIKIHGISYRPGYSDMRGGHHESALRKDKDGCWSYVCRDRENFRAPEVTTVYKVSAEAVEQLEEFISEKKIISLKDRPKSDLFVTDYSPWRWSIDYETTSFGKPELHYCSIDEFKEYSEYDSALLDELYERFTALQGEKAAEAD